MRLQEQHENMTNWAIAIHGGASPKRGRRFLEEREFLLKMSKEGGEQLELGIASDDVVVSIVSRLEESALFIAGRGASPNKAGQWELDASIMIGSNRKAGAVASMVGFECPISVAREVSRRTPFVLLTGEGAETFASTCGFDVIPNPNEYYSPCSPSDVSVENGLTHGTVGVVALDKFGNISAGTSTGGLLNKMPGRVGDSPIIGAGTWASDVVGVSCTGQGEFFLKTAAAVQVDHRMRYGGEDVYSAAQNTVREIDGLGGDGGLIAVDSKGNVAMSFNSEVMKRSWATQSVEAGVAIERSEQTIIANS